MIISDEIRTQILARKDGGAIKKLAIQQGMKTLREDGVGKILRGITTIEELLANSQKDE
jgi:general secretion pathway protein E